MPWAPLALLRHAYEVVGALAGAGPSLIAIVLLCNIELWLCPLDWQTSGSHTAARNGP